MSVQEIMKTGDFESITVIDPAGIVRAASQQDLDGKPYQPPQGQALAQRAGGLVVTRYQAQGEPVLGFEAPITFQRQAGRPRGARPDRAPAAAGGALVDHADGGAGARHGAAVAVAMYFVANWFAQPIKLLGESMAEIAKGRFDHRIREQRKDEFGQLYAAFDQMAQALNDREAGAGATPTSIQHASTVTLPASRPVEAAAQRADDAPPQAQG